MNIPASIKRIETVQALPGRGQPRRMNIPASIKRIETWFVRSFWDLLRIQYEYPRLY